MRRCSEGRAPEFCVSSGATCMPLGWPWPECQELTEAMETGMAADCIDPPEDARCHCSCCAAAEDSGSCAKRCAGPAGCGRGAGSA